MNLSSKAVGKIIGLLLLLETLSFLVYLFPGWQAIVFVILALAFLALACYKLEWGVLILLAELFIGSKGYLFALNIGGLSLSIRIIFWLIVMAVWLGKFIHTWVKTKQCPLVDWKKIKVLKIYYLLAIFAIWGVVNGFLQHQTLSNLLLDVNGWLFFLLIFPLYTVFVKSADKDKNIANLKLVFTGAVIWLSIKTLFFLYVFSHNLFGLEPLYLWLRKTGVGEITPAGSGFFRIFFQSHIYVVFAWLLLTVNLARGLKAKIARRQIINQFLLGILFLSVIILSFSRSFWLGTLAAALFLIIIFGYRSGFRKLLPNLGLWLAAFLAALLLMVAVIKFPIPKSVGSFNLGLLSNRADLLSGESAISSRWALLSVLKIELAKTPLFGQGFGATVTYKSSDPRVLANSEDGLYTTYAFEWGYLDIWLKLGFLGFVAYTWLLFYLFRKGIRQAQIGLAASVLALAVISVFTPYLNHPLGIGALLLVTWLLSEREI